MAELFGRDKSLISRHLRSVSQSVELELTATVARIATVPREGVRGVVRDVEFLHRNGRLFRDGAPVVIDVGLAALALLVAESAPKDKEIMIRIVMNMLADLRPPLVAGSIPADAEELGVPNPEIGEIPGALLALHRDEKTRSLASSSTRAFPTKLTPSSTSVVFDRSVQS